MKSLARLRHRGPDRGLALAALLLASCLPAVREAPFRGAEDQVTDATLLGPFDGQIVDAVTGEPIADATVVAVWNFDVGTGLVGPAGSETRRLETDKAGRYRIAPLRLRGRAMGTRLVDFHLVVYKRGYASYRSDAGDRRAFTVRHNTIRLEKWTERRSHADELFALRPPRDVARASTWQNHLANVALYRELGGTRATGSAPPVGEPGTLGAPVTERPDAPPKKRTRLDASTLLSATELRQRTGDTGLIAQKDLTDLPRTAHYHGVHLEATGRSELLDVSYRVWASPPGGLEPVIERFEVTLEGVEVSSEVTDETWVLDAGDVRAVAFVDRVADAAVLVTCGQQQCADIETVIVLARTIRENLDKLQQEPLEDESGDPEPADGSGAGDEPTVEPTPDSPDSPGSATADPAKATDAQETGALP